MEFHSVMEIYGALDETRARLYRRLEGLGSEQEVSRKDPDGWSVAEIVEHLAIMEERLLKLFTLMLMKAESAEGPGPDFKSRPVTLDQFKERSLKEKYVAPDTVSPTGNMSVADSLARLQRSRASLHELRTRFEATDVSSVTYPHPAFGPLTLYQWLLLVGTHEERHLHQIESLLSPELSAELSAESQKGAA